ncbi:wsv138 [White spot syndrome virus]|uniref:Wsv138 n=4 Tax=White spot syndrome virus TaxID=342409 RepID=Q8VB57_WSSVS|nr:wsv138 [Shrimp white spot syndrome virus]AFX59514.1 wsv138 [White spot syndrome virus]AAL33142.1 wsv138 [Shrimp white spot syndrome virus]AAL89061.1 WSSV193 [Shrimp white spot syndrome virus]AWQ60323.1 wsv138 [Shrimp white spot syndrome virus]AWQ60737.1 wsv138 [Shrimp white spot syndrome virus]
MTSLEFLQYMGRNTNLILGFVSLWEGFIQLLDVFTSSVGISPNKLNTSLIIETDSESYFKSSMHSPPILDLLKGAKKGVSSFFFFWTSFLPNTLKPICSLTKD